MITNYNSNFGYTWDIANFVPWTKLEYCPDIQFDHCYALATDIKRQK